MESKRLIAVVIPGSQQSPDAYWLEEVLPGLIDAEGNGDMRGFVLWFLEKPVNL